MSIETLKTEIAREFGTPAVVIDLDRVEANIARVQQLCDAARRRQPAAHQDAQEPGAGQDAGRGRRQGHHLPEARRGRGDGRGRPRRHPHQLQPAGRGEDRPPGPAAEARADRRRRRQPDDHRGPAEGRRDRRAPARRRHRVRHGPQARRRRDGQGGGRAGWAHQGEPGLRFDGFLFYPTETSWPQTQRFFDEAPKGVRALGLEARIVSTGGTPNLPNSASSRAPPSTAPAPTSSTTA